MTVAFFVLCLVAMVSGENLLDLAKQIGANSLVKLVNDAGLGSILASGGKSSFQYAGVRIKFARSSMPCFHREYLLKDIYGDY